MSADFWAGYISGAAGLVIGNPLDLIKVRLQAQTTSSTTPHLPELSPAPTPRPHIHTLREALRGLPAPVLTYGALNALLFTSYNRSLFLLSPPKAANHSGSLWDYNVSADAAASATYPYWAHFTAGAIAGLATFVISAPTELVKCRAQVITDSAERSACTRSSSTATNTSTSTSNARPLLPQTSWQITKATLRTQGIPGLYHGGVITSLRDSLGYGAYFVTYEASKDLWNLLTTDRTANGDAGVQAQAAAGASPITANEAAKILICGGLAGIATWVSIFPLDVIKTRVQTQPQAMPLEQPAVPSVPAASVASQRTPLLSGAMVGHSDRAARAEMKMPAGAWQLAKEAYRTEGPRVFFRGLTVCCIRAFIVNAVQWTVYEWIMRELR